MSQIKLIIEDTDNEQITITAMGETGYNGASRAHQFCKALNEHFPAVLELLASKVKEGKDGQGA